MKVSVNLNHRKIASLQKAAITALEKTGEALHTRIVQAQVVPRDTGVLQGEAFFVDYTTSSQGFITLVHSTPYARRLYYHPEYKFQTDENPNAKGNWFEDWLQGGADADFTLKAFAAFYKEEGGF